MSGQSWLLMDVSLTAALKGGAGVGQKVEVLTKEQTACVLWPATEALLALTLPQSPESSSLSERLESQGSCAPGDPGSPRTFP